MWRLKQFIPKEQAGLEGKTVDVGSLKLQVRSTIAQGGFSVVYLARDPTTGRNYALKHIICNDTESVDLVKNEVAVMKLLRGHPNIVTLHAQVVYDMGRTKECFLVMDYCEKMLANVLESRGAGYFEEKQLLLIFRDVCNAVCAMHCQSPPIAHRDLKVENVLMGGDGTWKLCDFGSTSTNHKRFEKADEMGLEEDIIRKHTTPAYRAPEMWDLYRRELINEKVDIWALGCLLYRIAYFKSAFDGESKLQILNGNYRIPDAPRYSAVVVDLIRSMLTASPDERPDVMQVWRRVNDALPSDVRKSHPDKPPTVPAPRDHSDARNHGQSKGAMPARSPPLPPVSKDTERRSAQNGSGSGAIGAFWSTPYAQDAQQVSNSGQDKTTATDSPGKLRSNSPGSRSRREDPSPPEKNSHTFLKKNAMTNLIKKVQGSVQGAGVWGRDDPEHNGYEMRHESDDLKQDEEEVKGYSHMSSSPASGGHDNHAPSNDPAFNEFAAHFDNSVSLSTDTSIRSSPFHADTGGRNSPSQSEAVNRSSTFQVDAVSRNVHFQADPGSRNHQLQADLDRLNKELQQALAEKAVVSSQYEKLTAICRSQRQEIQELKNALASTSSTTASSAGKGRVPPTNTQPAQSQPQQQAPGGWQAFDQPKEKQSGTIWDLQEGLSPGSSRSQQERLSPGSGSRSQRLVNPDPSSWQAFGDYSKQGAPTLEGRRRPMQHARAASMGGDGWGYGQDSFTPKGTGSQAQSPTVLGNISSFAGATARTPPSVSDNRAGRPPIRNQPAGWAGF